MMDMLPVYINNLAIALVCLLLMIRYSPAKAILVAVTAMIAPVVGLIFVALFQLWVIVQWNKKEVD